MIGKAQDSAENGGPEGQTVEDLQQLLKTAFSGGSV
jgi:hypothetical protein